VKVNIRGFGTERIERKWIKCENMLEECLQSTEHKSWVIFSAAGQKLGVQKLVIRLIT
jgi:hypothetical protein